MVVATACLGAASLNQRVIHAVDGDTEFASSEEYVGELRLCKPAEHQLANASHLGKSYAADQSPLLPPCFSSTLISPITMPRSAALHMS